MNNVLISKIIHKEKIFKISCEKNISLNNYKQILIKKFSLKNEFLLKLNNNYI